MRRKRSMVFGAVSAATLAVGTLLYLLFNRSTIAGAMLAPVLNLFPPVIKADSELKVILLSFGADFCWAFALPFALQAVTDFKGKQVLKYFFCIIFCISAEMMQYFDILGGTFDVMDIAVMTAGTVLSTVIIYLVMKNDKQEDTW